VPLKFPSEASVRVFSILLLCSAKLNLRTKLVFLAERGWSRSVLFRERSSNLAFSFLLNANTFIFLCFVVHPLNNLFVLARKVDRSMYLSWLYLSVGRT